ncbi:MAG: minor capsid protein [Acetobacter sp.]|nr:minor capsid protein [Bacteroides sp.]MCM1342116.1 minor capsid protein [Acetobacter sp.]MCM1434335.1 minor capsid protein [Clostridiales bacterium]
MITVYDLSLDFDENFNFPTNSTIGKICDEDIAICFYNSKRILSHITTVGGLCNSSYSVKAITVLLRYTTDNLEAEQQAIAIQNYFNERKCIINQKNIYFKLLYQEPIFLGTDDTGVYEYSFEIDVYYER